MKFLSRRSAIVGVVCAATTLFGFGVGVAPASAQSLNNKAIRIVVPFGPGGVADLTVRVVAQKMSENIGQPIIIDNRPGAGGIVASDMVAKAAPDGRTLLLMSNGSAVTVGLFKSLPFDTINDLAPISTLGFFDLALITPENSKFKTIGEFLAYAKANPGKLNLGSIAIGSTQNLAAELFKTSSGINVQIVPFNGTPSVITALRGGQIDAAVEILAPVLPQIQGNALQALAVMGDKRAEVLPNVPTVKESGVANFNATSWNALAAPAKTPANIIAQLNKEVNDAVNSPEVKKKLFELNVEARAGTPKQMADLLSGDIKRWSAVIEHAGIPKQ